MNSQQDKTTLGFWTYIMTDCVLFATLFATFAVLRGNTASGPTGGDIFNMPFVLVETILLLSSSFTCGLALIASMAKRPRRTMAWLGLTLVLGVAFLTLELTEFSHLISDGHSWQQSAFLSSFFTLVGTHGLHIAVGLFWLLVLVATIARQGLSETALRRIGLFSIFWHFLDVIWIFIFSIVYLMGVIS